MQVPKICLRLIGVHVCGTDNYCYQRLGGNKAISISTGMPTYGLYPVTPGAITLLSTLGQGAESVAPSPSLMVEEPSISYLVPLASPSPQSVAGGPTSPSPPAGAPSERSASSRTSVNFLVVPIVVVFVILCVMN